MISNQIRAIETPYAGCRFRSRLEARWAYFLDLLRVDWEYEKEAYRLNSGDYLPDFWLPEFEIFVEVKGQTMTAREHRVAIGLAHESGRPVAIMEGDPADQSYLCYRFHDGMAEAMEFCWWMAKGGVRGWDLLGDASTDNDGNACSLHEPQENCRIAFCADKVRAIRFDKSVERPSMYYNRPPWSLSGR